MWIIAKVKVGAGPVLPNFTVVGYFPSLYVHILNKWDQTREQPDL